VYAQRETSGLDAEAQRLVERHRIEFIRAGAMLDAAGKDRLRAVMEALADVFTRFRQNVMADERRAALVLEHEADLAGLSPEQRAAAAADAEARGLPGKWVIGVSRSSVEPFLQASTRRDLRQIVFEAFTRRGDAGETDNKPLIAEILRLRAERARLLGFETYADYALSDTMAGTQAAAEGLLLRVWAPALRRADEERADMQALIDAAGGGFALAAWDWRFYAEQVRRERFALDEAALKPYFQLDQMIAAVQDVAGRLFGLSFVPRADLPVPHPDVRVWEVRDRGDTPLGLFYGDYFARPGKRSGAWMSSLRVPHALDAGQAPIVTNTCNFVKPAPGRPALLSLNDARTLFHEFGHGLHGLLSRARYPSLSATNVALDFVELPSQIYEHWLLRPEVLRRFARHAETGETLPEPLIERIQAARHFNQGFTSVEMIASALVDLAYHRLPDPAGLDAAAFERDTLAALGMPSEIAMRHRSTHFAHIFDGDFYAAGYYAYLWAEVLDADGFQAFVEAGDPFDAAVAERLRRFIYEPGNSADPAELYRRFRGRDPGVEPLLAGRGLLSAG
jgi:peptidyl-dipeptidase Dcp